MKGRGGEVGEGRGGEVSGLLLKDVYDPSQTS